MTTNIRFLAEKAKEVALKIGLLSETARNEILLKITGRLLENSAQIIRANKKDIAEGKRKGLPAGLLDRIFLDEPRVHAIADSIRNVASLPDPLNKILESRQLPNGLYLKRVSVPIGVIGMIYEARPNVTVDTATLCLKSGNVVILKGGSDAIRSNRILVQLMREVLKEVSFLEPTARLQDAVQLIDTEDRNAVMELLGLHGLIDVAIPRGGKNLINFVRENSKVPVIETGASVVHIYIHKDADTKKAVKIIMNSKLRRVGICNALDSLILHQEAAPRVLKALLAALPKNPYKAKKLEIRADSRSFEILRGLQKTQKPQKSRKVQKAGFELALKRSTPEDYHTEFLDYILAVRIVHTLDEAIGHIYHHSLKHTEVIVTEDRKDAERFLCSVDAACVYWNCATQFSDGGEFGLGTEIGISTQKLHVRGPFALEGLTSYKWIAEGNGQIRIP